MEQKVVLVVGFHVNLLRLQSQVVIQTQMDSQVDMVAVPTHNIGLFILIPTAEE